MTRLNWSSGESVRFVDRYRALGLTLAATSVDIRRAFLKMAKTHHPDVAGGDENVFREANAAYQVLRHAQSRQKYDKQYRLFYKEAVIEQQRSRIISIPTSRLVYPVKIETLLEKGLLTKKVKRKQRRRMLNINYDLELPLRTTEIGRPLQLKVPLFARIVCPDCKGSDRYCRGCNGKGSYKSTEILELEILDGLRPGQVIEVNLEGMKPGILAYFKKKQLLIKTSFDVSHCLQWLKQQSSA